MLNADDTEAIGNAIAKELKPILAELKEINETLTEIAAYLTPHHDTHDHE